MQFECGPFRESLLSFANAEDGEGASYERYLPDAFDEMPLQLDEKRHHSGEKHLGLGGRMPPSDEMHPALGGRMPLSDERQHPYFQQV